MGRREKVYQYLTEIMGTEESEGREEIDTRLSET